MASFWLFLIFYTFNFLPKIGSICEIEFINTGFVVIAELSDTNF